MGLGPTLILSLFILSLEDLSYVRGVNLMIVLVSVGKYELEMLVLFGELRLSFVSILCLELKPLFSTNLLIFLINILLEGNSFFERILSVPPEVIYTLFVENSPWL